MIKYMQIHHSQRATFFPTFRQTNLLHRGCHLAVERSPSQLPNEFKNQSLVVKILWMKNLPKNIQTCMTLSCCKARRSTSFFPRIAISHSLSAQIELFGSINSAFTQLFEAILAHFWSLFWPFCWLARKVFFRQLPSSAVSLSNIHREHGIDKKHLLKASFFTCFTYTAL